MIMMHYIITMLSMDQGLANNYLSEMLGFGSWIVGIFAVAFILYINSFLMKRRTKEFGLFNVLGMDKPQIASVVFIETVISFLVAVVGGIVFGTLFSKLLQLVLLRMIRYGGNLTMQFSLLPALRTIEIFGLIYFVAYLTTLKKIYMTKPIDLMSASNAGEKAPRANWLLALIGFGLTGGGYWLAQYVKNPMEAFSAFFIAVALVMVGTFFLFTSCSIAILKLLQKNKKYYYKKNHFINVSGMMYRMKQNASGLAQICILSCMVLVTISMTVSLYAGTNEMNDVQNPRDVQLITGVTSEEEYTAAKEKLDSLDGGTRKKELIYLDNNVNLTLSEAGLGDTNSSTYASLHVMSIDTYNQQTGRNIQLKPNEIAVYCSKVKLNNKQMKLTDATYDIEEYLTINPTETGYDYESLMDRPVIFIYTNDPFTLSNQLPMKRYSSTSDSTAVLSLYDIFDSSMSHDEQIKFCDDINNGVTDIGFSTRAVSKADRLDSAYQIIGSILFIGVFLGGLFLIATVLIIYYKQVSEGYEDRQRYEILQQVGLSKAEVKKTINSQVLAVFFLPLAVALLHITFAFHLVYELMAAFGLTNTGLFVKWMLVTAGAFAVVYAVVYLITSRVYYHIIETKAS
jgi:putative ABC transport system permease protein